MKKFKIYANGTGGEADYVETGLFPNEESANEYACHVALDDLAMYGGLHGYPDPDEEDFEEEAQSWISYHVKEV